MTLTGLGISEIGLGMTMMGLGMTVTGFDISKIWLVMTMAYLK